MSKFKGVRRIFLFVSFSLIITLGLLIHVSCAEAGGIGPNQGFDYVTLLAGQKADIDVTQSGPFGIHTVGIVSIGNKKVKASITIGRNQNALGLWFLILSAPGGEHDYIPYDTSFGLVSASEGHGTKVSTPGVDFCLATGSILLLSPVSAADPFKYTIGISTDKQD